MTFRILQSEDGAYYVQRKWFGLFWIYSKGIICGPGEPISYILNFDSEENAKKYIDSQKPVPIEVVE